jgi:hypothetical protein
MIFMNRLLPQYEQTNRNVQVPEIAGRENDVGELVQPTIRKVMALGLLSGAGAVAGAFLTLHFMKSLQSDLATLTEEKGDTDAVVMKPAILFLALASAGLTLGAACGCGYYLTKAVRLTLFSDRPTAQPEAVVNVPHYNSFEMQSV